MRLAGYAAIFDAPDSGGDIVRKGAFARSAKAGIPLLWQHDAGRRIGFVESLSEDDRGLRVVARWMERNPRSGQAPGCPSAIPVPDDLGTRIAARAISNVGVSFRLHGRTPQSGLDCVGLLADALRSVGFAGQIPEGYGYRGQFDKRARAFFQTAEFAPVGDDVPIVSGDFGLIAVAPRQLHFIIFVSGGFVHAHAGLRRVVLTPGTPHRPLLGRWRYIGE